MYCLETAGRSGLFPGADSRRRRAGGIAVRPAAGQDCTTGAGSPPSPGLPDGGRHFPFRMFIPRTSVETLAEAVLPGPAGFTIGGLVLPAGRREHYRAEANRGGIPKKCKAGEHARGVSPYPAGSESIHLDRIMLQVIRWNGQLFS